jgi:plasmid stabilization system protein ParE
MRVEIHARARDDISEIYEHRSREHSPRVATHVGEAIRETIGMLARDPELGTETSHKRPIRRWPMSEYPITIFYAIDRNSDVITIIRVTASARVRDLRRMP